MTAWDVWTCVAIGVLEIGSVAVFGWFLVEVVRLARARRSAPADAEDRADR